MVLEEIKLQIDQAKSYFQTNCLQRKDADDTLTEYIDKIKWLPFGHDTVLDIGSRSGDVLFDYIFPLIPKNFSHIVGTDKSNAMVSYATENYRHPNLFFEQFDIANQSDVDRILGKFGSFHHITSFCNLHWIMDQELAFKNIFDLLTPNGDMLITICQHHPLYEHYRDMSTLEKWKKYRTVMKESTSPYFGCTDPVKMLRDTLEMAGFQDIHVELKDRLYHFDNQVFIDSTIPVAPIFNYVPEIERKEFLITYIDKVMTMKLPTQYKTNSTRNDGITIVPYRTLAAYARKGNNTYSHNNNNNNNSNTKQTPQKHVVLKKGEVRMYNAKTYHATNCMQRKDALDTITEYRNIFQWSPEGDDSLLDIGSGSGDAQWFIYVTYDYIVPLMPSNFSRLIGSDKSLEMIEYSTEHFKYPKMKFEQLDIGNRDDVKDMLKKYGQFDRITSFCCLHWAMNQDEVMENIFDLLQPGGEILITICQHHPLYEHYADMCELPKWSKYRADMKKSTSPYFRIDYPEKKLMKLLDRAGFEEINVILKDRLFPFDKQVFIDSTVPVAPFLDKISEDLKEEFLKIYIDKVLSTDLPLPYKTNKERNDGKTLVPFRMLVAHAKKPSNANTHV